MINTEVLDDLNKSKKLKNGKTRSEIARSAIHRGKMGERWFADTLTKVTGMKWIRVPRSGAACGSTNREQARILSKTQGSLLLGDIIQPDDLKYRFILESKAYTNLDIWNMLNPKLSMTICEWINELLYDVETYYLYMKDKPVIPLLCIKNVNKGNWIIFNHENLISLIGKCIVGIPNLSFQYKFDSEFVKAQGFGELFYMMDFKSFIEANNILLFEKEKINQI